VLAHEASRSRSLIAGGKQVPFHLWQDRNVESRFG
jgi:hypothetical protein